MTSEQNKSPPNHTPGPWHVENDIDGHFLVCDAQDVSIARCYQQPFDTWKAEDNASLIAAAPELLNALQNFMNGVDTGFVRVETDADETLADAFRRIRAALQKASGAGMSEAYAIQNINSPSLYWNNTTGYGSFETAKSFSREEKSTLALPIEGKWVRLQHTNRTSAA